MSKRDPVWLLALADVFINLSAGWFGVVVIIPNFWPPANWENILLLIYDLIAGILFLIWAVKLRRLVKK